MAKKRANGEGSIRKRADGRWEGRYTAGYHPETGKRIIKNVLGKTQAECKAKLKKAIEESQALDISRANEYTVATWLRTWFELYAKPHIRPSTMNYYHRNIEQHVAPAIGDIPLNKLTTRDLQKLYNDLQSNGRLRKVQKKKKPGLSNSTVRGIHMMLHNALDRAVKEKLILSNPTENCIIPKIEKQEMKILHPDHISSYLNAAERRNALPMFYLELVSGLRKGELVALLSAFLQQKSIENRSFRCFFGAGGVTRTPDLLITNQLLYRLSYTSISIFDSDHNTIFLSQRQHPFQFSPSMRLSCFCILLYVLLQVFLQNKCCHFFILHYRVIVNCGKIEKICRCISAILS